MHLAFRIIVVTRDVKIFPDGSKPIYPTHLPFLILFT
jgi:hypothetical protein